MRLLATGLTLIAVCSAAGCGVARPVTGVQVAPKATVAKKAPVKTPVKAAEIKQTDVKGVAALLAGTPAPLFLDVRQPDEFAAGHAPGAVLRPLPDLATWAAKLDKNAPLVVMCHSGRRSMAACNQLVGLGFTNVTNVQGGFLAWDAAGLPVER